MTPAAADLQAAAARQFEGYVARLRELVEIDSGSDDPEGVDRAADRCQTWLSADGWDVERVRFEAVEGDGRTGDALVARYRGAVPADEGGRRVLLLAHHDTVFPAGTVSQRGFRIDGDRALGPGVVDDKNGVVAGMAAVAVLADLDVDRFAEVVFVLSSDEEQGSPASTAVIRRAAADADVALCLEAARPNGDLVSARKGVAGLVITIEGRAAHAGVQPERGINAALEAAHQTVALQALNDRLAGVTCNVGVLRAGNRPNVVADHARLEVDVRAWEPDAFAAAIAAVEEVAAHPTVPGTTTSVRHVSRFPPMPRTPATGRLVTLAQGLAADLGFELGETSSGGGSDANNVAALGVPVLDGLAPVGGDPHAVSEWLDLTTVTPRVALLAGLIARLGSPDSPVSRERP